MEFNQYIDHTLLKPDATYEDIIRLCEEAKKYHFYSVCVHPYFVPLAKQVLLDTDISISTVVGFPFGMNEMETKAFEIREALTNGADEIDMVMNMGAFKSGDYDQVFDEIYKVSSNIKKDEKMVLKVIIETGYLSRDEILQAAELCVEGKADFVKTSTGFGPRGVTLEDIYLIKENFKDDIKIKASGGIGSYRFAKELIEAGADRLGASKSVLLMKEKEQQEG